MSSTPQPPWYKQFWPWFIIFFPASAVVAGLITVGIAFKHSDTLVKDNWYKDGLAINQQLDKQTKAKELGITAQASFDRETKQLSIMLTRHTGNATNIIHISLIHPTQPEKDADFSAYYTPKSNYVAQLKNTPKGFFHLRIDGENPDWQLNGGLNFSNDIVQSTIQPR